MKNSENVQFTISYFRKNFDLEMVNLICPNEKFCSEFNLLFLEESKIEKKKRLQIKVFFI